jgi:hypothetical protein
MSFQPLVPFGGYSGWRFLQRTSDQQREVHANDALTKQEISHFKSSIAGLTSAEDLVADRTSLKVALGAFGLDDDLGNRFFIRKILEEGTTETGALATRLADQRYRNLSDAFGYGPFSVPGALVDGFADDIAQSYLDRRFEADVGEQNSDLRLALNLNRALPELASNGASPNTQWFSIMGQTPLRRVFETAFGLPSSFASLDIDQQLGELRDRANTYFGNGEIAQFSEPEALEDLTRLFLIRSQASQVATGAIGRARVALTLLQSMA